MSGQRSFVSSDYGLYSCWHCLCEVCTRVHCPKLNRRSKLGFCTTMIARENCPVVKCDFFQHKQKYTVYRIKRKGPSKKDTVIDRLDNIEKVLDRLEKKL